MINKQNNFLLLFMGVMSLIWLIPVIGLVVMSFRPEAEIIRGWWRFTGFTFTLSAWIRVWTQTPVISALRNSFLITGVSTFLTVFGSPPAAFAYNYLHFPGRKITLLLLIILYVLPPQVQVIPLLILWRELGLIGNPIGVVIPFSGLSFTWSIFMVKNYLTAFPDSLIDAARIDGCSHIQTYYKVVQPNILAPVFAVAILQFLWTWNALLLPLVFLRDSVSLPILLVRMQGMYEPNWDIVSVVTIIMVIIPLFVFLKFQRQFYLSANINSGAKE